jgi:heterodisulfide reductase subunit A
MTDTAANGATAAQEEAGSEPAVAAAADAGVVERPEVLVLGGGIAGIQAALNLAELGTKVHLVEESSTIGGIMARLNKTFPTNDCSICIEAPMMYEVTKSPNINLLTYTELRRVKRQPDGSFKVRLRKKPRFVDEEKCKGCGKCVEVCPVTVPDPLDKRIGGTRKLISVPIPQAVPNTYVVANECRYGQMRQAGGCIGECDVDCIQCRECQIAKCVVACRQEGAEAVLLWQRDEQLDVNVSAIIVAVGLEPLEPPEGLFGFGLVPNVITNLDYERLTNAGGPTKGSICRPSDGAEPGAVAWIQCAGRDTFTGRTYCSKICCMAATKQAIISKEHAPDLDTYIFYTDIQTYGKGFHEFHARAEADGVVYIRGKPAEVMENPDNGRIILRYEDIIKGEPVELEVDILVLSVPLVPSERITKLAKILKLTTDEFGFIKTKDQLTAHTETEAEGIFVCGGAAGPIDISESVTSALAASAKANQMSNR